jgi:hypothetical protein
MKYNTSYSYGFDTKVSRILFIFLLVMLQLSSVAQVISEFIIVDQFGYLPESKKIAVLKDPQEGFDAAKSYTPGLNFSVVNATTGEKVFRAARTTWGSGKTEASSGDKAWHFNFSVVTTPGTYYILDEENNLRSYDFVISHNVYNEVLKQAMRSFFYQRAGFKKDAVFAGPEWADSASHIGPSQDKNCRSFFDKTNPASERDLSGGWYDAGDYNKYTNWTANYVVELMKAYIEKPEAWADDYNIPESGNGIPDILDETKWGIDFLLRMQQEDGSVLSIVGESHASPPSSATGPSYYGRASTSATANTAAALAISSGIYRSINLTEYADTLLARAVKAWNWVEDNPAVIFNNNDGGFNSVGLGAGNQEVGDYDREMIRLEAACYLFEATGDVQYRDFFDAHYLNCHLMQWSWAYPFEALNQEVLLYYTTLEDATASIKDNIINVYMNAVVNGSDNLAAYKNNKDPYMAYIKDYTWGSNGVKAAQGSMYYNLITYNIEDYYASTAKDAALAVINYIHGVNPLNFVYLSNMYRFGADKGVNEFYHSWFCNGSSKWDRVGVSTYGPPPGYLTGGPNPGYNTASCCPKSCGSAANNAWCTAESLSPPKDQPAQKSYKDFNTSWPVNSWEVTENSCGYQVNYIRLLSKFVTAGRDCQGDDSGSAYIDSCGICAGGNTGIIPSSEKDGCTVTGNKTAETMYVDGRHLYSAEGEKVILRGVNEMFVWSTDKTGAWILPEIAKTGANCVRLVWTEDYGNKQQLVDLIENCIANKMIAMPECHSATGDWNNLNVCIDFWKDPVLVEGIQRNKKWTLLNIGNEVGDGNVTDAQFKTGYKDAVDSLRAWGYTVPLVIDASTWGQNVDIIFNNWKEILEHDTLHNVIFSVHSYWSSAGNYDKVASESINKGLPVIIGEGPSPTAYPNCTLLDFGTGLAVAGRNEIGWLSWSWGAVSNSHCVPYFDHTADGLFGNWETSNAASMMAEHRFSLMRTAERPPSFFEGNNVTAGGIYISILPVSMYEGDSVAVEVIITPVNSAQKNYTINISGDPGAAVFHEETGMLAAQTPGTVTITAISQDNESLTFSRTLEVQEKIIPVTQINVTPSQANMVPGDTIFIVVEVVPEDATNKEFVFDINDDTGVIDFDQSTGMIVANMPGTAEIIARWTGGDVEGSISVTVIDATQSIPPADGTVITIYPNPGKELLNITCSKPSPLHLILTDLKGRIVLEEDIQGKKAIDIRHLSPGVYEAIILMKKEIIRKKLVKI